MKENQDFSSFLDSTLPEGAQIWAFCPKMVNTQRINDKTDQTCRNQKNNFSKKTPYTIGCFILVKVEKSKFWNFFRNFKIFWRLIWPLAPFLLRYRPQNPYPKCLPSNSNGFWVSIQFSKLIFDQVMGKMVSTPSDLSFLPFHRRVGLLKSTIFGQKPSSDPVETANSTFYC